ncbi:hypothetical protein Rpal_1116 [Rhodopseudomonas palustris TIE-1]|nr:hypothetical protein Rpal_1116 [Rhodopseudomonas palustris TIE-1]
MAARSNQDWRLELVESYADLFHPRRDPLSAEGWPQACQPGQILLPSTNSFKPSRP